MFNSLSDRLQDTFDKLRGKGRLTEDDINVAMREIRMALLEADVNFRVVKNFVARCKEKCLESDVLDSLTPAQNVVRIVLDELTVLLGSTDSKLTLAQNRTPNVIMLVGLQGSGKTTAAAKLAYLLKSQGHSPLLAACDTHRPAAADQLATLGSEIGVSVYRGDGRDAVAVATGSIREAVDHMNDIVIVDTAGRLQIDEEMMEEAVAIKRAVRPDQILMVVDAMTGQDIVNVVTEFANRVDFDGVIMSKLDGDARGGGALSVREVTGKPIKFVSMGEKPDSLEVFHPDRMAKRILGMGDVVGIIEQAQKVADEQQMEDAERMLREGFTMDDLLKQMQQIRKMGGLQKIMGMIPGMERAMSQMPAGMDDSQMTRIEAIIHSMTKEERARPKIINGQRRKRIAVGSGRSVQEVNQLIKQWDEMNKMMGKMRGMAQQMGGKGGKKSRRAMQQMMRNMGGGMGGGRFPF
ncbi:signal recognition particle protein [Thermophilibacter provencensis]|uniref:Signal recognition particle protein n=1 Tax=Thermophilibacter provencensis TaxID=1852386 RepID=A0ABT7V1E7_9ACTN|nr:signal recognition particle protein [Thermophilibacter provencensis]MDM8270427.1 signal recognition particle protein [Thermophilibacter provencensis]